MKVLFLCTANIQRSRTAEDLLKDKFPSHSFKSAGLSEKECLRNNSTLCSEELLAWADKIYTFEPRHAERIENHTQSRYLDKIECLHIEDRYQYMQHELIEIIDNIDWPFI